MTEHHVEPLAVDPFTRKRSIHERNAVLLRDDPALHGKWCVMARYDNPDSPAHQAWRLNHKIFGPKGKQPDDRYTFRSKWYDDAEGKKVYCLLGKYQP